MGFAPREVKQMTLWEYMACVSGWNRAQSGGHAHNGDPMTDEEYDKLCELGDKWNGGR
jgi:hypothetical protein